MTQRVCQIFSLTEVELEKSYFIGTFRPDRIRSIAERFGVDGSLALENILYGETIDIITRLLLILSQQLGHSIANTKSSSIIVRLSLIANLKDSYRWN